MAWTIRLRLKKYVADLGVHDQIDVPLPVSLFRILEAVEFFGKGAGRFGDQR